MDYINYISNVDRTYTFYLTIALSFLSSAELNILLRVLHLSASQYWSIVFLFCSIFICFGIRIILVQKMSQEALYPHMFSVILSLCKFNTNFLGEILQNNDICLGFSVMAAFK